MVVVVALAALWCAAASVLLRRRSMASDDNAGAWRWFSWACAIGAVILAPDAAFRAVGERPWAWAAVASLGSFAAGACAYQGMLYLHRRSGAIARVDDWSNGLASVLALVGAGNALAARFEPGMGWREQPCILQVATWVVVLGTATSLLGLTGLGRRPRAWAVLFGLWSLVALHVVTVASAVHDPAGRWATLGSGPIVPILWAACATAAVIATQRPASTPAREASASSAAGGATLVVALSLAIVVTDAAVSGGPTLATVVACSVAGMLGLVRLATLVGELSRLAASRVEARTDVLTGLANRRGFLESLTEACQRDDDAGLVILDMDGFKEVNDTLGHAGGDRYIEALAARFRRVVPAGVALARIGGDEFAAVVQPASGLDAVAEALLAAARQPLVVQGRTLALGASAGVATASRRELPAQELMRRADAAMYVAKRSGGELRPYDEQLDVLARSRQQLLRDLRGLLGPRVASGEYGNLVVYYQPQVDVETGVVHGAEALVRWEHPRLGLLRPAAFLPLVEEHGLTMALTTRVLGLATTDAVAWPRTLAVSVNVAAADLGDSRTLAAVENALAASGLAPWRLTLEVTETMLLRDPVASSELMQQLRRRGVRFSLDDYGTGYSSLTHLKDLPVDELKIDRSFVEQLATSMRTRAIVAGTVQVARGLDMTVVGEGVEDNRTLAALRAVGGHLSQGYLHATPLPEPIFRTWCAQRAVRAGDVVSPRES
ncbi:MAG TPA: EAL domain-containing protein [Cellulomonas sp.]